ncbi:MAG: hypothetical protein ACQEVA_10955 [Myxococcota bacterium]
MRRLSVILSLTLVLFSACNDNVGSSNSGAQPSDEDTSSDATRDGSSTVDAQPDSSESDADGSGSDTGGTQGGAVVVEDCTCAHEDDVCVNGECTREGLDCAPGECPASYRCARRPGDSMSRCTCAVSRDECGPFCEVEADCPSGTDCDLDRGVCEPPSGCAGSIYQCPVGQTCENQDTCKQFGDVADGSSCDANPDCSSGICLSGVCEEACLVDSDCDADEYCGIEDSDSPATCKPRPESCPDCPEGTRCVPEQDACEASFCLTTEDCESGDCIYAPGALGPGTCATDDERKCKPHEWRIREFIDVCATKIRCNDAGDCSAPYSCRFSWCAREL